VELGKALAIGFSGFHRSPLHGAHEFQVLHYSQEENPDKTPHADQFDTLSWNTPSITKSTTDFAAGHTVIFCLKQVSCFLAFLPSSHVAPEPTI
jgi:hypothetical protein